jgi:hypothetical protein
VLKPVPLTVEEAESVVNAPVLAVVAPTVPLMLILAVPVKFVTTPLAGVPKAGVTKVGLVANTTLPLPVEVVKVGACVSVPVPVEVTKEGVVLVVPAKNNVVPAAFWYGTEPNAPPAMFVAVVADVADPAVAAFKLPT